MNTDVYIADQICYVNEINRHAAVCYALKKSVQCVQRTVLFQNLENINKETKKIKDALDSGMKITDPNFPLDIPHKMLCAKEADIDNFLIGTFFELTAKSFLLNKGYLIHSIDKKTKNKNIKKLAESQDKNPVRISALLEYENFSDYKNIGRNGLKSLEYKTIDYGKLFRNNYESQLGFDENFNKWARIYRIERNLIHFPLMGASETAINDYERNELQDVSLVDTILDFIKSNSIPLFNNLKKQHALNISNIPYSFQ